MERPVSILLLIPTMAFFIACHDGIAGTKGTGWIFEEPDVSTDPESRPPGDYVENIVDLVPPLPQPQSSRFAPPQLSTEPCIRVEPSMSLGPSPVGQTSHQRLRVTNCSYASPLVIHDLFILGDLDGVFSSPENVLVIERRSSAYITILFEPSDVQFYDAELIIRSDDPIRTRVVTSLHGEGVDNDCPSLGASGRVEGKGSYDEVLTVAALSSVELAVEEATNPASSTLQLEWLVTTQPTDSRVSLKPNPYAREPTILLDLVGRYVVQLRVIDENGIASCKPSRVIIDVVPTSGIHIELTWYTPSIGLPRPWDGADLDLHYRHPAGQWNQSPYDIFWRNSTQNWGTSQAPSIASLDLDNLDGTRPEVITHESPQDLDYAVGVHYFSDNSHGPSYATVRIYVRGELRGDFEDRLITHTRDFWYVGLVRWPSGEVVTRDEIRFEFP